MACTQRRFTLEIPDDGAGFDPGRGPTARRAAGASQGLANIRRRAELLDAQLDVESAPGRGHTALAYDAGGHDSAPPAMTDRPNRRPPATIRILIADDHEVVRIGLAAMLAAQQGFERGRRGPTGDEAARLTAASPGRGRHGHPHARRLGDRRLPRDHGGRRPGTPVIMLTSHADSDALFEAIDAGASGYVLKRVGSRGAGRRGAHGRRGGSLLDPAVTRPVLDRMRNASRLEEAGAFADLTEQERRVLAHIADGASNRQIAERMGLAEKTVRNYVSNILAKLALESRAAGGGYAIRNRLPELARGEA